MCMIYYLLYPLIIFLSMLDTLLPLYLEMTVIMSILQFTVCCGFFLFHYCIHYSLLILLVQDLTVLSAYLLISYHIQLLFLALFSLSLYLILQFSFLFSFLFSFPFYLCPYHYLHWSLLQL